MKEKPKQVTDETMSPYSIIYSIIINIHFVQIFTLKKVKAEKKKDKEEAL